MAVRVSTAQQPELWAGVECTVNRVGDKYSDQLERSGHALRIKDLDRLAELGVRRLRYPILWERTAPDGLVNIDWSWSDERLNTLQRLGLAPIVGLVHHGVVQRGRDHQDHQRHCDQADAARAACVDGGDEVGGGSQQDQLDDDERRPRRRAGPPRRRRSGSRPWRRSCGCDRAPGRAASAAAAPRRSRSRSPRTAAGGTARRCRGRGSRRSARTSPTRRGCGTRRSSRVRPQR